jgi:Zn finger protein HypA/HybF involved in hydrogenase expression
MKYKCLKCGNNEFISQLNQYDIFIANGSKLEYAKTELIDEPVSLYCRECYKTIFCRKRFTRLNHIN